MTVDPSAPGPSSTVDAKGPVPPKALAELLASDQDRKAKMVAYLAQ